MFLSRQFLMIVFVLLGLLIESTTAKSANEKRSDRLAVGQTHTVPQLQMISVEKKIKNETKTFKLGEQCEIIPGAKVTIKKFDKTGSHVLVVYHVKSKFAGPPCPDKTEFFVNAADLATYEQRLHKSAVDADINSDVGEILEGETVLKMDKFSVDQILIVPEIKKISVMKDFISHKGTFKIGDQCEVASGAKVKILGFVDHNRKVLVEYTNMSKEEDSTCPTGIVYFQTLAELAKYK